MININNIHKGVLIMGLAASQGRMLCLTARLNDLIYEGQQISQQRLALASQQQEIATEYTEKMNNTILQATTPDGETQRLTYDVLTSQDAFSGLGMRIVDANGYVVVPGNGTSIQVPDEEGNTASFDMTNSGEFIANYLKISPDSDEYEKYSKMSMSQLVETYNNTVSDDTKKASLNDKYSYLKSGSDERYCYDENVNDPAYLQEMLTSGEWTVQKTDEKNEWQEMMWQGSSVLTEVYDTSDDAAAESEYEAAMLKVQKQDKLLELQLENVQTQESAVEKDLDSIKTVIDKNIEDSFKTFA